MLCLNEIVNGRLVNKQVHEKLLINGNEKGSSHQNTVLFLSYGDMQTLAPPGMDLVLASSPDG